MKVLAVGDMHVVPEELDDCAAVINLVLEVCRTEEIKEVWFTGDQFHNHELVKVTVLQWWLAAFKALRDQGINSVCLVGNHDQSSPGAFAHAMMAFTGLSYVKVIDKPTVHRNVLMIPYMHDEEKFLAACREHEKTPTIFCHQTFDGSRYENGFLATDGFDLAHVPQELLISGHIHTGQEFGRVWYVGAPRWRSLADANVERSIWLLEFDGFGHLKNRLPFSTDQVCRQIRHVVDTPSDPVSLPLERRHQWRIDIKGPAGWCQKRKTELQAAGARVRVFPEQIKTSGKVRESEGIARAFNAYLGLYQARYGTGLDALKAMAKERLNV